MAVVGKGFAINGYSCQKEILLNLEGTDTADSASCTAGATIRGEGNSDWNAVAIGWGHTPPAMPGDKVTLAFDDVNGQGWTSSASGAIVSRVHIICPTLTGKFIFYRMYFAATGSMLAGTPTAADPGTQPNPPSSKGLGVLINGVDQDAVIGWELILDANLTDPDWNSSSTIDVNGNAWPVREAGDWEGIIRYSQRIPNTSSLPVLHALKSVRLEATSSTYWDINWARMLKMPIRYRTRGENGNAEFITAEEITLGFTGFSSSAQGFIKNPATTSIWPAA